MVKCAYSFYSFQQAYSKQSSLSSLTLFLEGNDNSKSLDHSRPRVAAITFWLWSHVLKHQVETIAKQNVGQVCWENVIAWKLNYLFVFLLEVQPQLLIQRHRSNEAIGSSTRFLIRHPCLLKNIIPRFLSETLPLVGYVTPATEASVFLRRRNDWSLGGLDHVTT